MISAFSAYLARTLALAQFGPFAVGIGFALLGVLADDAAVDGDAAASFNDGGFHRAVHGDVTIHLHMHAVCTSPLITRLPTKVMLPVLTFTPES